MASGTFSADATANDYNTALSLATAQARSEAFATLGQNINFDSASTSDRINSDNTYTVTFTNPFYSVNYAVGITAQGLATGDFFLLSNKTINGFDIAFKNSGGTGVSRTFDYIAKGF